MGSLRRLLESYSEEEILAVWEKGHIVREYDPSLYRKDDCGAWMKYSDYGDTSSDFGWEIDHITSTDHHGPDSLSNLRPLQWRNNRAKGSGRLKCRTTAQGEYNVIFTS